MSNTMKLLPCPFCGGEAELIINPFYQRKAVKCKKCYASIGMFDSAEQAIEAWNRRVPVKDEYEVYG